MSDYDLKPSYILSPSSEHRNKIMSRPKKRKSGPNPHYRRAGGGGGDNTTIARGIFFSCPRNKEKQAVMDAYDILTQASDFLYSKPANDDNEDIDEDETEQQLESELAALRKPDNQGKASSRFLNSDTGTSCLIFIKCPKSFDPVQLCSHVVKSIQDGNPLQSRYLLKMFPQIYACSVLEEAETMLLAMKTLAPLLTPDLVNPDGQLCLPQNNEQDDKEDVEDDGTSTALASITNVKYSDEPPIQYRIEPHSRSSPLSETKLKDIVTAAIQSLTRQPVGPYAGGMRRTIQVNLENPAYVILAETHKKSVGFSIVEGYMGDGRRWNLQELAVAARNKRNVDV